jgi:pyruvate/2-oxoglutarate dehydrogenase complex dihydrolipoamide acyltransferase (E2) component
MALIINMCGGNFLSGRKLVLVAGILFGGTVLSPLFAQSPASAPTPTPTPAPAAAPPSTPAVAPVSKPAVAERPTRNRPNPFAGRAGRYYALFWGIDSPTVKAVESGELIRFSYHVLDADKAKMLNDKKIEAYLISPSAGVRLSVPSLEKVGQLRQSSTPEAGKSYWMAFSNPGRRVKPGDRVNVVIGNFQAQGLVVE